MRDHEAELRQGHGVCELRMIPRQRCACRAALLVSARRACAEKSGYSGPGWVELTRVGLGWAACVALCLCSCPRVFVPERNVCWHKAGKRLWPAAARSHIHIAARWLWLPLCVCPHWPGPCICLLHHAACHCSICHGSSHASRCGTCHVAAAAAWPHQPDLTVQCTYHFVCQAFRGVEILCRRWAEACDFAAPPVCPTSIARRHCRGARVLWFSVISKASATADRR